MEITRQYRIIGAEVVGMGAFLVLLLLLELRESDWNQTVVNFAWVYAILGITLVLVGLEILWLAKRLRTTIDGPR